MISQNNKITKVMFTCEGPEYWQYIARKDEAFYIKLYSDIAGQPVPPADIYSAGGAYAPRNK